jgi:MFS transporter, DHA2 family, multidrug resistance protein
MSAATVTMDNANADAWRPAFNPWIIAHHRHAGDVHGSARHLHRQRCPAAHRRQSLRRPGRKHLGPDFLSGFERHRTAHERLALVLIGRKRFYMGCVALFTISSFLCGLAPNLSTLIVFRVLQGLGGGGLQPSEQAILADTFRPPNAAWLSPFTAWPWCWRPPSVRRSADGSLTISTGAGFSSLIFPSASSRCCFQDPPYFKRRKLKETTIDYVGLGFVALGLGALQIVLDKGQRDDWFESHFIVTLSIIAAAALIFVVIWEWRHKDPIIDLHLFRDRTFAVSNLLMFMLGFALLGSTLLLPLFSQTLLGYSAEQAGLALMPGGFAIILLLPLVGFLLSRYSPRWLLLFGLCMLSASLFHMTGFDLDMDFRSVALARVVQAAGMAFLFVPINTAAYAFLPRDKNNAASGLMNLARNIGGSVGISVVTTMLDRRSQMHMTDLSGHLSASNPVLQARLKALGAMVQSHGGGPPGSSPLPYAIIEGAVARQAAMLSYIDCFWFLGVAILCMVPMVFLMRKSRPGGGIAVH